MIRLFKHYIPVSLLLLGVAEAFLLSSSIFVARLGHGLFEFDTVANQESLVFDSVIFMAVMFTAMTAMGLYQRRMSADMRDWLLRVVLSFIAGSSLLLMLLYVFPDINPGWTMLLQGVVVAGLGVIGLRLMFFTFADMSMLRRRILVLGSGEYAKGLEDLRRRADRRGFVIVGYVPLEGEESLVSSSNVIAKHTSLIKLVNHLCIDEIVVAVKDRRRSLPVDELLDCKMGGVQVLDMVTFFERQLGKVRLDFLNPSWLIFSDGFQSGTVKEYGKRIFDLGASFGLLFVTWPIMLLTACAIILESGWNAPILYRQKRVGAHGKIIEVIKFRSMKVDAEKNGAQWAQKDDDRVTMIGRFIRKARIDELPQLYNVFRGHMSFVGPRPERPEFVQELAKHIPYYHERHRMKPGITGWAQICYPYGSSVKDSKHKLEYDLYYVKNHSLFLDLNILFQTAEVILWGRGSR